MIECVYYCHQTNELTIWQTNKKFKVFDITGIKYFYIGDL